MATLKLPSYGEYWNGGNIGQINQAESTKLQHRKKSFKITYSVIKNEWNFSYLFDSLTSKYSKTASLANRIYGKVNMNQNFSVSPSS